MSIDLEELRRLTPERKLHIINLLWEDLNGTDLPESEWQEIFRRQQEMADHPEESLTVEQMWAQVSRRPS